MRINREREKRYLKDKGKRDSHLEMGFFSVRGKICLREEQDWMREGQDWMRNEKDLGTFPTLNF